MDSMGLNQRAQEILAAVVREYILTGEAIGSRTLVRHQGIDQSPATVRNVMADLEEQGFLRQPHTSAGRIPTDVGLRFFVNRLMQARELTPAERQEILRRYKLNNVELQELLREISRLLSDLSKQCALVLVPRTETSTLKRVEFVAIRHGKLIAVLVMSTGMVLNRLLDVTQTFLPQELESIHSYLNELCHGKTLSEVRSLVQHELESEQNRYDRLVSRALQLGAQAVATPVEDEVVIEGQSRLLDHPLANDPEQMKSLLRAVEEKQLILRLLDETIRGEGVQVFIGAETREEEMRSCAIVASAYGGEKPLGTLGVIGPSSMDYPRVVPLVDFTAGILTEILSGE
jgi:heat-inducible transcriptional repressor